MRPLTSVAFLDGSLPASSQKSAAGAQTFVNYYSISTFCTAAHGKWCGVCARENGVALTLLCFLAASSPCCGSWSWLASCRLVFDMDCLSDWHHSLASVQSNLMGGSTKQCSHMHCLWGWGVCNKMGWKQLTNLLYIIQNAFTLYQSVSSLGYDLKDY